MLMRIKNPMSDLSSEQKIMFGVGAGALLAAATIGTIAWAASGDPDPIKKALEVGPACATFVILSEQKLKDDLRVRLRKAAKEGPIDPLRVTALYLRSVAPSCTTYPSNTQNPGQVKLFATVYVQLLSVMQEENFLSEADLPVWHDMMTTWASGQGVSPEEL